MVQHKDVGEGRDPSWDDLFAFLLCANFLSFRRAAEALGVTNTTLMRRLDRLEFQLGTKLFVRHQSGLILSEEGKSILGDVQNMEWSRVNVLRRAAQSLDVPKGLVRVATPEGTGISWILPKLVDFQNSYPMLTVDLRCAMEHVNVTQLEADIAVQLEQPKDPDLICARIGRMHIYPFVSNGYAERHGVPRSSAEWKFHRIVHQAAPQIDDGAYARAFELDSWKELSGIRLSSSMATWQAVELGGGVGFLPTLTAVCGAPLVPIDIGLSHWMDIWLAYHPDLKRSRRHMVVLDWLKRIFDPRTFPCFADDFIHPNDLVPLMESTRESFGRDGLAAQVGR